MTVKEFASLVIKGSQPNAEMASLMLEDPNGYYVEKRSGQGWDGTADMRASFFFF